VTLSLNLLDIINKTYIFVFLFITMKSILQRRVLKNGMIVLFEKRDLPIISIAYAVRYGGINEDLDEKGIAHFIEHMLYKGTSKRNSKQIAEDIEKKGGIMNGFTDEAVTAFWTKAPSKYTFEILDVLTDMVKNPVFDEKELEKERKVIFEEMKMRRDNPRAFVLDEIKSFLYEEPFGPALIGSVKTMSSIDRKKMIEKFKNVYNANNLIFVAVGDGDFEKLCGYLEKNFSKSGGKIGLPSVKLKNEIKIVKRKGIDQVNLVFAYHSPLSGDKLNYASEVLSVLMAEGMSSRLFSEIREKRNMAYAIMGDSTSEKDYGYNLIYVGTTKENVDKVKELILKEFESVSKSLSEKELNSIKEKIIGNYLVLNEDSQNRLLFLLMSEINGNFNEVLNYEKNISNVKLEDIKRLAKIKNYSFLALVPE